MLSGFKMKHKKHKLNPLFFEQKEKEIINKKIEKELQPFYHSCVILCIMFIVSQFIEYDLIFFSILLFLYTCLVILSKHIFHKQNPHILNPTS